MPSPNSNKIVFTDTMIPKRSGKFVYIIQTGEFSKIGRHNGSLSKLVDNQIPFYPHMEITANDCSGYDYAQLEKTVLSMLEL